MKKITFLISLLAYGSLLFGQSTTSPAQNAQPKPFEAIRVIHDQKAGIHVAVEFWDSTTNKRLKRVDLVKNSPFYNLKGRESGIDEVLNTPRYVVPFKILKTDPLFMLTDEEMNNFYPGTDSVGVQISSSVTDRYDFSQPRKYIGIIYVMEVRGHHSDFAASRLALAVYDTRGNLKYKHQGIINNGGLGFLLCDGRYFCYKSGGDYGEGVASNMPMTYTVFDMKEKKEILKEPYDGNTSTYGINQYYFATIKITTVEKNKFWAEWSIYDIENKKKYYKEYDVFDLGDMEKADKEGCIMYSGKSGKTTALKFEKDFTVSKMK
jgi:hypothetical protein